MSRSLSLCVFESMRQMLLEMNEVPIFGGSFEEGRSERQQAVVAPPIKTR